MVMKAEITSSDKNLVQTYSDYRVERLVGWIYQAVGWGLVAINLGAFVLSFNNPEVFNVLHNCLVEDGILGVGGVWASKRNSARIDKLVRRIADLEGRSAWADQELIQERDWVAMALRMAQEISPNQASKFVGNQLDVYPPDIREHLFEEFDKLAAVGFERDVKQTKLRSALLINQARWDKYIKTHQLPVSALEIATEMVSEIDRRLTG